MSGRPFKLLGVNTDKKKKTASDAIKENGLNWRSWWDGNDGPIVNRFKISAFPTVVLIDHRGVIRVVDLYGERLNEAIDLLTDEAESDIAQGGHRYPIRQFVDVTGKYKVTARVMRLEGDTVVLQKESGQEVKVPITKLSQRDQTYVSTVASEQ